MPYVSRQSYPYTEFGPYTGGVNYSRAAQFLGPNEIYSMQNCRVDTEGGVSKREGILKHNSTAMNSGATVAGCGQVAWSPTTDAIFAVAGNQFLEDDAKDGTFSDLTNGQTITAGALISHAFGNGQLMLTDGTNAPLNQAARSGALGLQDVDARFTVAKYVAYWDNRAWWAHLVVGGSTMGWRVWRSDVGDVGTYGATNFHNIMTGEVEITAIHPTADFLAVHYRSPQKEGIAGLVPQGLTATPYVPRYFTTLATVAPYSVQNLPGSRQIFVRMDGIYVWNWGTREVTKVSQALDGARYWDNVAKGSLHLSHSLLHEPRNEYWLTLPYGSVTTPNHTIIYDHSRNIFYGPMLSYTRASSCVVDRKPYMGDFAGFLQQHETGDGDNSAAIDGWFTTAALKPEEAIRTFRWLRAEHYYDSVGGWFVTVEQLGRNTNLKQLEMGGDYDLVQSTFKIAVSRIGGGGNVFHDMTQLLGHDSHLQFRFRNPGEDEPFTMRKTIAWYKPRKES